MLFQSFVQQLREIRSGIHGLEKRVNVLAEQEPILSESLDGDYCRLQLIYCKALILTKKSGVRHYSVSEGELRKTT